MDQKALLPIVDLIVCRSGASTIAEIQSFGLASLLIPSPHVANNHQYYNAKSLFDQDACDMMQENEITDTNLNERVESLLSDSVRRESLGNNAHKMAMPNAVRDITELVTRVVDQQREKKQI